jgi:hypothetical protein
MKSCLPPTMFSPAQEAPALPSECVIGYPPSPTPTKPSLGLTIGFGLAMGAVLASIGIAVATLLFL